MKSCLIIAGEKSGEEHAMSFFPALRRLCPEVNFYGIGGDDLRQQEMELVHHLRDFSSMGFSEVIQKLPFYFRALRQLEELAVARGTSTAIVIDFQDFNLRLAQRLARRGVKVLYYVAPQAWAWKPYRAQVLARTVHTLFTILPFEKAWFSSRGVHQVRSIPHPLMLTYKNLLQDIPPRPFGCWKPKLKLLLLPGSRRAEISSLLPIFMQAVRQLKLYYAVEIHLVKVAHVNQAHYDYFQSEIDVLYDSDRLTDALKICHLALAASGTVTLSTGLFELPTIVCYQSSLLNEFIFRNFIQYQGPISLTNIIHDKMVFPELTQEQVEPARLVRMIRGWIEDEKAYNDLKASLKQTKELLAGEDFSVPHYMAQVINE
jgi:lipid-A-disaccharide synthase